MRTIKGDMRKQEMVDGRGPHRRKGRTSFFLTCLPNISGSYAMDHARSVELCEHALEFAQKVLKPLATWL